MIFHQETADLIENRLLATIGGIGKDVIDRLFFSPDSRAVVLLRSGGESGRYLQRIPLVLNNAEIVTAPRTPKKKATQPASLRAFLPVACILWK